MTSFTLRTTQDDAASWRPCHGCGTLLYARRLASQNFVCPECRHHFRIPVTARLGLLLDSESVQPLEVGVPAWDVLGFVDTKPYPLRLVEAAARTGLDEAAVAVTGRIAGAPVVVVAMDFQFLGGSMGTAVGEIVTRAAEYALATRTPLLTITASGGARMQEGCLSLMQMAKTSAAFAALRAGGVLTICLLTDPTFGGVTASFATLGDVLIAEPGALIGFAGPRVIANAVRQPLPEGFQTAEYLLAHGMLDCVEPREGLPALLGMLLRAYRADGHDAAGSDIVAPRLPEDGQPPWSDATELAAAPVARLLRDARAIGRPTTLEYAWRIFDEFVELHGDRLAGDDPAMVGGLGCLNGCWAVVLGHQKGNDTASLIARNFGMARPEGYRKATRLMRLAQRLRLPVLTFIDTQGAAPDIGAEDRGQSWAISESLAELSGLTVPVVATIIGEGGSGGALALAVANRVLMLERTCYSVISPESCSTILFGKPDRAEEMAERLRITPSDLLRLGLVDAVVPEPPGGAQADPGKAAADLRYALCQTLRELAPLSPAELVEERWRRFRRFGTPLPSPAAELATAGEEAKR
ncbi:MAG: acyl-CoA carboxylase subunit beta [Micromonosporaceae bacterium]|nr:acyl-CoA carboxylase subunit beta [Micromonosporaceae bacterium]